MLSAYGSHDAFRGSKCLLLTKCHTDGLLPFDDVYNFMVSNGGTKCRAVTFVPH